MPFKNRSDAGRKLAQALLKFRGHDPVVLALPRGGVPIAAEVAAALNAPLDLVLVRKIGVPSQPELAMGAVADCGAPAVVRNEDVIGLCGIDADEFALALDREMQELARRRELYMSGRQQVDLGRRTAIVIDDGIATGATIRAALQAVRTRNPKQVVLATPVAATDTLASLQGEADEIVCLEDHVNFGAIGFYYADFDQVSDEEVVSALRKHQNPMAPTARRSTGGV